MESGTGMLEKIGKYEVIRSLGKGATAVVYLARDPDLGPTRRHQADPLRRGQCSHVATSAQALPDRGFDRSAARSSEHRQDLRRRGRAGTGLSGDGVRRRRALDKFCAINRLLPMHRVIGIIFKCCLALDHAFRQGVVHRDIKPANILIDANDNPKITDFGLGLNLHKDMGQDSTFVMGVGSPAYMSPEQVKNYPLNHKTDLYSLGRPAVSVAHRAAAISRQQSRDAGLQDRQHGLAFGLRT
jgi:serine/threonine protein kinase